jgi:uncharacterized protein (TIGR03086 family)
MEPIEQLEYILPMLDVTVERIQVMQMNDPTPCSEFTVHDVLNHMMGPARSFAALFRGEAPPEPTAPGVYGWVPAAEFREAMADLLDAAKSPGAMERTLETPMGAMPGEVFARLVAFDGLVHGWDLATSTGQRFDVPPAVVGAVDEFARGAVTSDMRGGVMFKDETEAPEGASQLERLVAFSGRSL